MEIGVEFELELRFEFGQQQSPTQSRRIMLIAHPSFRSGIVWIIPARRRCVLLLCFVLHWSGFFPLWSRVDYFHSAPPAFSLKRGVLSRLPPGGTALVLAKGLHLGMRRDAAPPHVPAARAHRARTHRGSCLKYGAEPAPAASSADEGTTPKAAPKVATPFEASLEARTRRETDVVAAEVAFAAAVQERDAKARAYFEGLSKRQTTRQRAWVLAEQRNMQRGDRESRISRRSTIWRRT